jgi:hypothetical protein
MKFHIKNRQLVDYSVVALRPKRFYQSANRPNPAFFFRPVAYLQATT